MLIDKPGIARLIPHAGAMCLLDGVLSRDAPSIRCVTGSHRATDNPLRRDGRLGILCGVEYAAQAMALHDALGHDALGHDALGHDALGTFGERPRAGYLASLRAVRCHCDRLDLLPGKLIVEAERLHGGADRAIYGFALRHAGDLLLEGRAAVVVKR